MTHWPSHLSFLAQSLRSGGTQYKVIARQVGRSPQAVKRHLQRVASRDS